MCNSFVVLTNGRLEGEPPGEPSVAVSCGRLVGRLALPTTLAGRLVSLARQPVRVRLTVRSGLW